MNDALIRKFCESRYHWPIVATGAALLALAAVVPQADDYFDNQTNRNELSEELAQARQTANALPQFERQAAETRAELLELDARTVDEGRVAEFRSLLVELVRQSGCQIRQIDVGTPARRAWKQGDSPLAPWGEPTNAAATPFSLERRSVTLAVDGRMSEIHDLLDRLEREQKLMHPHRVRLQPVAGDGEIVTLELELWLFALAPKSA